MENRGKKKKILVIGSSNVDRVMKVEHFPQAGETIIGKSIDIFPGGKGANQAYACGRLGGETCFLSLIGSDEDGALILHNMKTAGVDSSNIEMTDILPTGSAFINVNDEGQNTIVIFSGANGLCDSSYLKKYDDVILESEVVVLQMEIPLEAVYYAVERASILGKTVILNPAPAPDNIPDTVLSQVDYLTPNETELEKLSGRKLNTPADIEDAAGFLLLKGVKNVIVTLGSRGAMWVSRAGAKIYAPPQVQVADTTAAGDTFNAAIAVRLAESAGVEEAIQFANFASSISVSRPGAQSSIPDRTEVEEFIRSQGTVY